MYDTEFKELLGRIVRGEADLAPERRAAFLMEHLDSLASPDPELRDSLFYEVADAWIRAGSMDGAELAALFDRLVSEDFLFRGLPPRESGSPAGPRPVLRRSFSILLVDSLLSGKSAPAFLALRPRALVLEAVLRYAELETELEGLSANEGWAHSVAHSADALATLALAPECTEAEFEDILDGAARLLLKPEAAYAWQEDKRIARILQAAYERDAASGPRILRFLDELIARCPESFTDPVAYARHLNVLNLARALYFQIGLVDEARGAGKTESGLLGGLETRIRRLQKVRILSA